jgi:hypothetical protein
MYKTISDKELLCEDTILTICALRFDGYRYSEESDVTLAEVVQLAEKLGPAKLSPMQRCCAFLALQRYLFKWGGERLPLNSSEWKLFRSLFLTVHELEIPEEYRDEEYHAQWVERIVPNKAMCVAVVSVIHETTVYAEDAPPVFLED